MQMNRILICLMGHLHDSVILLPRPESFVKMLSYSNLSSLSGVKREFGKIILTIEGTNSILVTVIKYAIVQMADCRTGI